MLRIVGFGVPAESNERSPLWGRLAEVRKALRQTARLMCGIPDYDGYVAHVRQHHRDRPVPSYEEFFRQRQDARYGRNGNARCC
jgi:uncharacterized short protein YbdD (DUF466 family)